MKHLTKERVAAWLESRFYLRLHMFLIVGGTYLAGLLVTKLLLSAGLDRLWLRYSLAVCGAYLIFLALLRIWLYYVGADRRQREVDLNADGIELFGHFVPDADPLPIGGGGGFGGGGATASWGPAPNEPVRGTTGGSSANKGCGIDIGGDEGCVVLLVVALAFSLIAAGVYMIWTAPALLAEAAFEAALAAALARRTKKIQRRGWVHAVWRATVWPFLIVLVLSTALGWLAQRHCPEAKRLRDVWQCERSPAR